MPTLYGRPLKPDSPSIPRTSERTLRVLERAVTMARLPHALLFYGDCLRDLAGVAVALTARLLDRVPEKVIHHPDLFVLRPANKMRQINVEAVREVIRCIYHSPQQGLRKVALIYEADRMNPASANAFLKTLEEPPSDTTLLLLTTRQYAVLDTLRSRCLHFFIPCEYACIGDAAWREWRERYAAWLVLLCEKPSNSSERAEVLLGLYGLAARFETCLQRLAQEYWKAQSDTLSPGIQPAQRDALEAGSYKGIRRQLFLEIEQSTQAFMRRQLGEGDPFVLASAFTQSVDDLENCARLLEVNLSKTAALEYFLLRLLRNWAR